MGRGTEAPRPVVVYRLSRLSGQPLPVPLSDRIGAGASCRVPSVFYDLAAIREQEFDLIGGGLLDC